MNPFALAYREQQQLFLFDKTYLTTVLFKVGGLSILAARFLVQFFWNPYFAVAITVCLLALSSYLVWVFIRNSRKDWMALFLAIAPSCLIGASLSDNNLHYDYLMSIMMVECALIVYKKLRSCQIPLGILMTCLLYFTSGPAALVFAICAVVDSVSRKATCKWGTLSYPVVAVICGVVAYHISAVPTLTDALTPSFHYEADVQLPLVHWCGWIALPAVQAISIISSKKLRIAGILAIFVLSFVSSLRISSKLERGANQLRYEYEYYTVNERWDELKASCLSHEWSAGTANYLNMAYAYEGVLVENLMKHDNNGVSFLLSLPESHSVDTRIAHIMYAMGNYAAAQDVAFNALQTTQGYSPAMLKMNAQVELMRGADKIADKYLSVLEKTLHYRTWAQQARKAAAEYKSLPDIDGFAMFENPIVELMRVIDADPSNSRAMQYGLSFLLLAKDLAQLYKLVDAHWGTDSLKSLPIPVQEALLFYSEYSRNVQGVDVASMDWCMSHGVSTAVINHFAEFQRASISSKSSTPKGFQNTYWSYLL